MINVFTEYILEHKCGELLKTSITATLKMDDSTSLEIAHTIDSVVQKMRSEDETSITLSQRCLQRARSFCSSWYQSLYPTLPPTSTQLLWFVVSITLSQRYLQQARSFCGSWYHQSFV